MHGDNGAHCYSGFRHSLCHGWSAGPVPFLAEAVLGAVSYTHLVAQIQNDPKNANKPEAIMAKMVDGRIGKFYETNCLLQQAFVKNGDITVEQYVADQAKAAGGAMKIAEFVRFEKGEGMQKREDNFADEVASMMK